MLNVRSWLTDRNALKKPASAELQLEPIDAGLVASIETRPLDEYGGSTGDIGCIDTPLAIGAYMLLPGETSSTGFDLSFRTEIRPLIQIRLDAPNTWRSPDLVIAEPDQVALPIGGWATQGSESLFEPLRRPPRDGKRYGVEVAQQTRPPARQISGERCIHGMERRYCAICNKSTATKRTPRAVPVTTVDVFDLVLPLLYPPINPDSPMAVVFPPNKAPMPFQYEGIRFLADRTAALLADEMGLGKTIQTIVALRMLIRARRVQNALVLCPQSLLGVWEHELREWSPELSLQRVRGSASDREALWKSRAHVCFSTYETFRNDIGELPELATKFDLVVLDEAQRIKNPGSQVSQACSQLRCNYRWALTGTPLENKTEDVVAIFRVVKPGLFASSATPSPAQIKERIRPYFLRRRTADVLSELPEKVSEEIWLEFDDAQREAYDAAEAEGTTALRRPGATRIHVFALINQLKQLCNWDPASRTSCKLDYLAESLENVVASSEKALVFSHYPEKTLQQIMPELQRFDPVLFSGSLNDLQREELIRRFTNDDTPRVLMASVQSGGVGLTLTRANHVFHYDHWWNPAVTNQATGRAHRIGQTRTVFVRHLYVTDTIEERIHTLLAEKQSLFDFVIDDMSQEDFSKTITEAELFGLFGLAPPSKGVVTRGPTTTLSAGALSQDRLADLTPRQFEELIAELYESSGFSTELTSYSRDGGVDLVARRVLELGSEQCIVVQCKHTPNGTVGTPVVQQLLGVIAMRPEATGGAIVTSGGFSSDARELAKRSRITLLDGNQLLFALQKASLL